MAYRNFMKEYSKMLGVPETNLSAMDYVYMFEREIAMRTDERNDLDSEQEYAVIELAEMQTFCPVLNWKWLLNELFRPFQHAIEDDQLVAIDNKEYIRLRCALFDFYLCDDDGIK
ncbi:hypothetical protein D915_009747 [Fasciola hepatica]|uniref:Peptidase M13 N-terminal domain-containing protein n=1 Tax=Fasciola hepatica TaxID=6192 RepID=A0A4E0R1J8_FASHE|nr:hypothetical protein D915_009747 [Fasciola hepatica]